MHDVAAVYAAYALCSSQATRLGAIRKHTVAYVEPQAMCVYCEEISSHLILCCLHYTVLYTPSTGTGTVTRDAAHSGADALAVVSPAVAYSAADSSSDSSQQQQQQQQVHVLWTVSGAAASSDSYSTVSDTPVYIRVAGTDSTGRELVAVVTQLPATGVLTRAVYHDVWMEVSAQSILNNHRLSRLRSLLVAFFPVHIASRPACSSCLCNAL
jgi:hypothetical protein